METREPQVHIGAPAERGGYRLESSRETAAHTARDQLCLEHVDFRLADGAA